MNILYLQDHGDIGGAQRSLLDLLKGLRNVAPDLRAKVVLGGKGYLHEQLAAQNVETEIISFPEFRKWKTYLSRHSFTERLAKIADGHKAEIIHANTHQVAPWSARAGKLIDIVSCCTVREVVAVDRLRKFSVFDQNHVVAISQAVQSQLPEAIRVRSTQIYNCISPAESTADNAGQISVPAGSKRVGFMGKLSERKGILTLIDAIPLVQKEIPNAHFLIAGNGDPAFVALLHAKLAAMKVERTVTFCGELENASKFFSQLDLFVLPSVVEGLGRVTVEAMYAGLPVVATKAGGTIEVVRDNETGRLVPPNDAPSLAREIVAYLQNESLRRRHGEAGKARAKNLFDVDTNARKLHELYSSLIKNRYSLPKPSPSNSTSTPQ